MGKFKVGDVIVCSTNNPKFYGKKATVVGVKSNDIDVVWHHDHEWLGQKFEAHITVTRCGTAYERSYELLEVWESPLMKALREFE